MKIYPEKPKADANVATLTKAQAYGQIRPLARGEITFETACANLGVEGKDLQGYVSQYRAYAKDVRSQMISNYNVSDIDALKAIIEAPGGATLKSNVVDDLLEFETAEGTFDAFKTKYTPVNV